MRGHGKGAVTHQKAAAGFSRSFDIRQANRAAPLSVNFIVGAALVQPEPAESDGGLDCGAEVIAAASREEGRVDALDVDAAFLRGLNTARDLQRERRQAIRSTPRSLPAVVARKQRRPEKSDACSRSFGSTISPSVAIPQAGATNQRAVAIRWGITCREFDPLLLHLPAQ
jgi:hypothetical protein